MDILMGILKVVFVLIALVMTFFILLQEGKGGGLAGLGGTKAAGVEGVTNPIRRATAILAIIFFVLAVLIGILARGSAPQSSEGLFAQPGAGDAKTEKAVPKEEPPALKPGAKAAKPEEKAGLKVVVPTVDKKAEAPKGEAPKTDAPKAEAPKAEPTKDAGVKAPAEGPKK